MGRCANIPGAAWINLFEMITKYEVQEAWESGETYYAIGAHCGDGGFFLPKQFEYTPKGKFEAEKLVFDLIEKYALPIDEQIIMDHFNKEILQ